MSPGKLLKRGSKPEPAPDGAAPALLAPGGMVVQETPDVKGFILRLVRTLLLFALVFVLLVTVLYSALSATLMTAAPRADPASIDRLWVVRGTFTGGQVDNGMVVYGSASGAIDDSVLGRLKDGYIGTSDYFVARSLGGPFGAVTKTADGAISVEGEATGYSSADLEPKTMRNEYLMLCLEGACGEPGAVIYVPEGNIGGEVRGTFSLKGLDQPYESVSEKQGAKETVDGKIATPTVSPDAADQ